MLDDSDGRWMQTLLTFLLLVFIVADDLGIEQVVVWIRGQISDLSMKSQTLKNPKVWRAREMYEIYNSGDTLW